MINHTERKKYKRKDTSLNLLPETLEEIRKLRKYPEESYDKILKRLIQYYHFIEKKIQQKNPIQEKKEETPNERFQQ